MKINIYKIAFAGTIALMSTGYFATNTHAERIIVSGETTTEIFKVYGNCGMCEKKIEGSLANVKGVKKADWNKETNMMEVTFVESEITLEDIKKKIASVGYDTDEYKATDESYDGLPGCCQYEREIK